MTKRVLFLANGLGLGNSTRCHAVIEHLVAQNCRVRIITSNNGLWYFRNVEIIEKIYETRSLYYVKRGSRLSIPRTLAAAPNFMSIMRGNASILEKVLEEFKPDAVVADSIYSSRTIKQRGIPLVNINNADVVVATKRNRGSLPTSVMAQYRFVEYFDYLYHKYVPDVVLSPSLDPTPTALHSRIHQIGPIFRSGLEVVGKSAPRALIMLSGSVFGTQVALSKTSYKVPIDVVGRDAPLNAVQNREVRYLGRQADSKPYINSSTMAMVNGGFSAVSEMFYRRCPMVVLPVPGHAEQWVNANTIERLGVGISASEPELEDKLNELIERAEEFSHAYKRLPLPRDGAAQAAKIIMKL